MSKTRLEAFSDGVFAIVITLLILDIKVPEVTVDQLPEALRAAAPRLLAYVMTFVLIGMYWVFHHNAMLLLKKVDGRVLWFNIAILLAVSFLPFPASLLGRYPWAPVPAMMYGANLIAANVPGFLTLLYLRSHPELAVDNFRTVHFPAQWPVYAVVNSMYLVAVLLAPLHAGISYGIYAVMVAVLLYRSIRARTPVPAEDA